MTINNQLETERREAKARNWRIVCEIIDDDVSGATDPFARPQLGPLLRGETVAFDAIVFPKPDRASRDTLDGLTLLKWAQTNHKRLIILDPYMDSTTMTAMERMHFVMGLEMGAYEREQIINRVRVGVKSGRLQAKYLGGKIPLWLKVVPHPSGDGGWAYDVDEEKLVLVLSLIQKVRHRFPDGRRMPYGMICRELNEKEIPTPDVLRNTTRPQRKRKLPPNKTGVKMWVPRSLQELLSNRLLIGQREVVKYEYLNGKRGKLISREIVRDDSGKPVEYCPAIIEYDVFVELQEIFGAPRQKAPIRNRRDLQHVVTCIGCHAPAYYKPPGEGMKSAFGYYICSNRNKYRTCPVMPVKEARIKEHLEAEVLAVAGDLEVFDRIDPPKADYASKLAQLRDEQEALTRLYRVTKSESGVAKLEKQIGELDAEIVELEARAQSHLEPTYLPTGRIFLEMWNSSDWHARGDLLRGVGIILEVGTVDGQPMMQIKFPEDYRNRLRHVTSGRPPSGPALPTAPDMEYGRQVRKALAHGISALTEKKSDDKV